MLPRPIGKFLFWIGMPALMAAIVFGFGTIWHVVALPLVIVVGGLLIVDARRHWVREHGSLPRQVSSRVDPKLGGTAATSQAAGFGYGAEHDDGLKGYGHVGYGADGSGLVDDAGFADGGGGGE